MRLHRYRGRENGLMVIGNADELKSLGEALVAFAADKPFQSTADWPPLIHEFLLEKQFMLSFHLDTASAEKPESNIP